MIAVILKDKNQSPLLAPLAHSINIEPNFSIFSHICFGTASLFNDSGTGTL